MSPDDTFLTDAEVERLTGRKVRRLQCAQLRNMLIPFRVNALGQPIVTRAALNGLPETVTTPANQAWSPGLVRGAR